MSRIGVTLVAMLLSVSLQSQSANHERKPTNRFAIDEDRPYAYVLFDHVGKGVKFAEDEPSQRIWLRFVNNCEVGIVVRAFGIPEGSPREEVGVMLDVVKNTPSFWVEDEDAEVEAPPLKPKSTQPKRSPEPRMPGGYYFDLATTELIAPGKSVLFSIPVTFLAKSWHVEIPYEFDIPPGKGPRHPLVGGLPRMVLVYYSWDLPEEAQQRLVTH